MVGVVPEPAGASDVQKLRDASVDAVFDTDFGDAILAGVAFAPRSGGDAVGFTRPADPSVACPIETINEKRSQ